MIVTTFTEESQRHKIKMDNIKVAASLPSEIDVTLTGIVLRTCSFASACQWKEY